MSHVCEGYKWSVYNCTHVQGPTVKSCIMSPTQFPSCFYDKCMCVSTCMCVHTKLYENRVH